MESQSPVSLQEETPPVQSYCEAEDFKTFRYEETTAAKGPIAVTIAPPRALPTEAHSALRSKPSAGIENDISKRDSGLAPTESTGPHEGSFIGGDDRNSVTATTNGAASPFTLYTTNTPSFKKSDSSITTGSIWKNSTGKRDITPKNPSSDEEFCPITTLIPSNNQLEIDFMTDVSFSKRGSVLLGGKKVMTDYARDHISHSFSTPAVSSIRVLPEEIEKESQKVRSMYKTGLHLHGFDGELSSPLEDETMSHECELFNADLDSSSDKPFNKPTTRSGSAFTDRRSTLVRHEHEMAGGIEDWEDVQGEDVDRYGFIILSKESARGGTPEPRAPQRVSTALHLASETPRKRRGLGTTISSARSSRSTSQRSPNHKVSPKSLNTQTTTVSRRSDSRPFRTATNRLPGNKNRRWMDEAGDMLTLPPGLADIAEDEEGGKAAESIKRKEWDRAEKWRKMAKIVKNGKEGEGMQFEFDVRNPKLIERTWKGIPDRWRATAWYSFLGASAKKKPDSATDAMIVEDFHRLLDLGSVDDVQIDMDVPRTINSHIMFRKRYRGGQRLLFRVLHCLSLYFPDTGYVQGMASLAATLLCYYDEEKTFIMLVRMWQLRGLGKLYESGFPGLMAALDEFQTDWIGRHAVTKKLVNLPDSFNDLSIEPTSYGTRWYLTLFNYSIPFVAQLRVWDVFMLLGDIDISIPATIERPFQGGLDIIHAASTALIDGTRDILLDSDFENAMKALTSWIPVKDDELFMKVAKAEWRLHHSKKRG